MQADSENGMLSRIFGPKKEHVREARKKLHAEKLHIVLFKHC
jgi:hypothetical protein